MNFRRLIGLCCASLMLAGGLAARAETPMPTADLPGTADLSWLQRYAGSYALDYVKGAFDEIAFPASVLKKQEGDTSSDKNNVRYRADTNIELQGTLTRFLYVAPADRSPLEVVLNYKQAVEGMGGTQVYTCKEDECGGDERYGPDSGGGSEGIPHLIYPESKMKQPAFSPAYCGLYGPHSDFRYSLFKVTTGGADAVFAVFAFSAQRDSDCTPFNQRTVFGVVVLETKAREQRMETVSAAQMGGDIMSGGKAVLYGILFDTDKATIKPESKAQLDEIAAFLKTNAAKKYLVVGHTDNQGELAYNADLSNKRAAAVVAALTGQYGIAKDQLTPFGDGMTAPVASNDSEDGRAKNRRVEIVAR